MATKQTPRPCKVPMCAGKSTAKHGYCAEHEHLYKPWTGRNAGKGRGGRAWRKLRDKILKRDRYLCQCEECKATGAIKAATEVDHIKPISAGGTDSPSNLCAINSFCHKKKTQKEAQQARIAT